MMFHCEKCDKRIDEKDIIKTAYPDFYFNTKMIDLIKEWHPTEIPEEKLYHKCFCWRKSYNEYYLCGPLHEESPQEYFIYVTLESK